jgi:hypothetical protein
MKDRLFGQKVFHVNSLISFKLRDHMDTNLFISWSGEKSKCVALALEEYLPLIINAVKPFLSANIDKGMRWSSEIDSHLKQAKIGIICLTPENLEAPWILFEAGALANAVDRSFVCPYLYKVQPTEILDPLSQFQATNADKEDTRALLHTINQAISENLPINQVNKSFDKFWPDLENDLKNISDIQIEVKKIKRTSEDMLEELLELARSRARKSDRAEIWINEEDLARLDEDTVYDIVTTICKQIPEPSKMEYAGQLYDNLYLKWKKACQSEKVKQKTK